MCSYSEFWSFEILANNAYSIRGNVFSKTWYNQFLLLKKTGFLLWQRLRNL
jgi:hypothetical protein